MKRQDLAKALILCLTMSITSPAFAGDDSLNKVVDGSLLVTRVGGVGAGLVFGTPVAAVRSTYKTYIDMTEAAADKVGSKDLGPSCLLASLVTVPASLVIGTAKGIYLGGKNALTHGFNEPFSPASLSLGKLED